MKKFFNLVICVMALLFAGCEPNEPATSNKVETSSATDITTESVVLHGKVNVDISQYDDVEFGMMVSEDKADLNARDGEMYKAKVLIGEDFELTLEGLSPETKYYYCAWVFLNNTQYEFGETNEFTTLEAPGVDEITILTGSAEDVTYKSVVLYGELKADMSNYSSVQYGISYSTNRNDLQSDNSTLVYCSKSLQENSYSVALSGLEAETKYYYCAFVYVNNQDFKFGTVKNFTTLAAPKIDGIGMFSVSDSKQVTFSKGNLQYTRSTDTWSFASAQWKMIGTDNVTGGSVSSGEYGDSKEGTALADKVDLFGWSTSATNFGVSTSTDYNDYSGSFVDWGTNKIGNDAPNTWRTLTYDEWYYVVFTRPNASSLKGVAQVNGVNGLILLPDNWICPSGVSFKSGFYSDQGVEYYAAYQTFTAAEWSKLDAAGAVFLPAAGSRYGSDVDYVQNIGYYWSANEINSYFAYYLYFYSYGANMSGDTRRNGRSVRLVKDL